MNKVNLIIIGAGRSGTTSLYHYLQKHPQVAFSDIKEVHYFSLKDLNQRGENYLNSYFTSNKNEKIKATADTYLLIDKKGPKRVFSYNPEMKIIALLREPVSRAYSSYHYALNNGYQSSEESFADSIRQEKKRIKECDIILQNNLCHCYGSLYYQHLRSWMEYFPKEQLLLLTTEEMESNLEGTLHKIASFLKIDEFKNQETVKVNKSSPARLKGLQQFLVNREHPLRKIIRPIVKPFKYIIVKSGIVDFIHKLNRKEKAYTPLSPEARKIAEDYLKEDLKNLKEEFGVSFKH